jgi:hypothetical protein
MRSALDAGSIGRTTLIVSREGTRMLSADASDLLRRNRITRRHRMPSRLSEATAVRDGAVIGVSLPDENTFRAVAEDPYDVPPHAPRDHAGSGRCSRQPDSGSIS